MKVLETERLILRPIGQADALAIFEYASDPDVTKWVAWPRHTTIDDTLDFIRNYALRGYREGQLGPYGITLKEAGDDSVVGTIGTLWTSREHAEMEFGYVLAKPFWGQGFTTEACKIVLEHAFQTTHVHRIQACCVPDNYGSRRVLEKVGFVHEGLMRDKLYHQEKDVFLDADIFSLLRDE